MDVRENGHSIPSDRATATPVYFILIYGLLNGVSSTSYYIKHYRPAIVQHERLPDHSSELYSGEVRFESRPGNPLF